MRTPKEEKTVGCFEQTRKMFASVTGIHEAGCHDYEAWMKIEPEYRAAALYCIFYDVIMLARKKSFSTIVSDEDAVSEACKVLFTETARIEEDPAKYSSRYIYTAVYRAMLRPVTVKSNKWYSENRVTITDPEDELDCPDPMFNLSDDVDVEKFIENDRFQYLWSTLTEDQKSLVLRTLNHERETTLSRRTREKMIREIRMVFAEYRPKVKQDLTFADIYRRDDDVEAADVEMLDGEIATYYGCTNDNGKVVFFGATRDYEYSMRIAQNLRVVKVDFYE